MAFVNTSSSVSLKSACHKFTYNITACMQNIQLVFGAFLHRNSDDVEGVVAGRGCRHTHT